MAGAGGGGTTAPLRYQEPIGGDAERAMMMKSPPAAALEVSPSEFLFQFFVISFDDPAVLGQFHQISPADSSRQCRQPILGGLRFSGGPFDQQPLFLMRFRLPVIPRRASNSEGCKRLKEKADNSRNGPRNRLVANGNRLCERKKAGLLGGWRGCGRTATSSSAPSRTFGRRGNKTAGLPLERWRL